MSEFGLDVAARSRPETARAEAYAALYSALDETSGSNTASATARPAAPVGDASAIASVESIGADAAPAETGISFGTRDQSEAVVYERTRSIPQGGQALARSLRAQLKAEPPVPAEPAPDSLQAFLAMARAAVRRKAGEDGTPESGPAGAPLANPNGARDRLARLKARLSEPTPLAAPASVAPAPAPAPEPAPVAAVTTESVTRPVQPEVEVAVEASADRPVIRDDVVAPAEVEADSLPLATAQIAPLADDMMFIEDASVPLVVDQAPLPLNSSASIETVTSPPVAPLRSSEQSARAGYVPPAPISQPEQAPRASLSTTWSGTAVLKAVPAARIISFSLADLPDMLRERARAAIQQTVPTYASAAILQSPMPQWVTVSLAALGGLCVFGLVFGLHFALR